MALLINKKAQFAFLSIALLISSCSKDITPIDDPKTAPAVSDVPESFIQKVLIESFTQTFGGQCPKADLIRDSLVNFNPNRVYGVAFHIDDVMADPSLVQNFSGTNYYDSLFNPSAIYPAGVVNRQISTLADASPDQWASKTFIGLSRVPSCGIALEADAFSGSTLHLNIHVGFSENMFGQYMIHAYLVQGLVQTGDSLYDQLNDFSFEGMTPDTNLALYSMNDTIRSYPHRYVLRRVATPNGVQGFPIPESIMTKGNKFVTSMNVDLTGINTDNTFVIVFVDKHATSFSGHRIENVQMVAISETKDWN